MDVQTAPPTSNTVRRADPNGGAYGPQHQVQLAQIVEEPIQPKPNDKLESRS
jgi:hypothetical protein